MKSVVSGIIFFAMFTQVAFSYGLPYKRVSLSMNLDRKIFYTGKPEKAVLKVSINAVGWKRKRVPVNLVILIDKSGSMVGSKIQMACSAAIYAAKNLNKGDIISVVTYGNSGQTVIPPGTAFKKAHIEKIKKIQPSGNTALFSGLSRAIFELRKNLNRRYINRIVIISDGFANVGITGIEEYERLGASLKKEKISVSTIGIGTDYNEDLMVGLSSKSSGNSYFVEKPQKLTYAFAKEIKQLKNVVARDILLKITCPSNVKPLRIVGREGRIKNGVVTLSLDHLSLNQKKFALLEIMVPKGGAGKNISIARALVSYEDPFLMKKRDIKGFVNAAYSNVETIVKESRNFDVKRSYLKNLNAISNEKALDLIDQGKKQEAVKIMVESSKRLKQAAEEIQDDEALKEVIEMKKNIKEVKKAGKLSKKKRKFIKMKSYETRTQQKN